MNFNFTLIGQTASMVVFVWLCMKYIWPHIITAMNERQQTIADGLAAAERGQQQLIDARQEASDIVKQANERAKQIVAQAQQRSNEIVAEAKQTAVDEGNRLKQAAQAEITQETQRARESLRTEVSVLAIAGAEKVLSREIDNATHQAMLDELAAQL